MADFELEQEIHTMSLEHLITPENKEVLKQNKTRLEKRKKNGAISQGTRVS